MRKWGVSQFFVPRLGLRGLHATFNFLLANLYWPCGQWRRRPRLATLLCFGDRLGRQMDNLSPIRPVSVYRRVGSGQSLCPDGSILLSTFYNPLSSRPAACRVLERFFPECPAAPERNKSKRQSTGYGLPIAARNVAAHGGLLRLESRENEGTTVTILLPRESQ